MQDGHRVSRAVHFPQSFPNGSFDVAALLFFRADDTERSNPNRTYKMSVVCRCIMPQDDDVHAYGVRIETRQNADLAQAHGGQLPDSKKRTYLGFYDITYDALADLLFEHYKVAVRWVPENGEVAHLEVQLKSLGNEVGDKRRRADRSAALKTLSSKLTGPTLRLGLNSDAERDMQSRMPLCPAPA